MNYTFFILIISWFFYVWKIDEFYDFLLMVGNENYIGTYYELLMTKYFKKKKKIITTRNNINQ